MIDGSEIENLYKQFLADPTNKTLLENLYKLLNAQNKKIVLLDKTLDDHKKYLTTQAKRFSFSMGEQFPLVVHQDDNQLKTSNLMDDNDKKNQKVSQLSNVFGFGSNKEDKKLIISEVQIEKELKNSKIQEVQPEVPKRLNSMVIVDNYVSSLYNDFIDHIFNVNKEILLKAFEILPNNNVSENQSKHEMRHSKQVPTTESLVKKLSQTGSHANNKLDHDITADGQTLNLTDQKTNLDNLRNSSLIKSQKVEESLIYRHYVENILNQHKEILMKTLEELFKSTHVLSLRQNPSIIESKKHHVVELNEVKTSKLSGIQKILEIEKEINSRLDQKGSQIAEINSRLDQKGSQIAEINSRMDQKGSQIAEINSRMDQKGSQIAEINSRMDQKGSQIAEINSRMDQKGSQIAEINSRMDQKGSQIAEINSRMDQKGSQIAKINSRMDQRVSKIAETNSRLDQRVSKIAETNSRLDPRVSKITETNSRLDQRVSKIAEINQDIIKQSNLLKSLKNHENSIYYEYIDAILQINKQILMNTLETVSQNISRHYQQQNEVEKNSKFELSNKHDQEKAIELSNANLTGKAINNSKVEEKQKEMVIDITKLGSQTTKKSEFVNPELIYNEYIETILQVNKEILIKALEAIAQSMKNQSEVIYDTNDLQKEVNDKSIQIKNIDFSDVQKLLDIGKELHSKLEQSKSKIEILNQELSRNNISLVSMGNKGSVIYKEYIEDILKINKEILIKTLNTIKESAHYPSIRQNDLALNSKKNLSQRDSQIKNTELSNVRKIIELENEKALRASGLNNSKRPTINYSNFSMETEFDPNNVPEIRVLPMSKIQEDQSSLFGEQNEIHADKGTTHINQSNPSLNNQDSKSPVNPQVNDSKIQTIGSKKSFVNQASIVEQRIQNSQASSHSHEYDEVMKKYKDLIKSSHLLSLILENRNLATSNAEKQNMELLIFIKQMKMKGSQKYLNDDDLNKRLIQEIDLLVQARNNYMELMNKIKSELPNK